MADSASDGSLSRRELLKGLTAAGVASTLGTPPLARGQSRQSPVSAPDGDPPNILWITGENLSLDLGCYGQENVETPHLDNLADEGVRYSNAFATSPVCAPSRSAIMPGMYQTTTGTHHMPSHRNDDYRLPDGVRPLTHRLQDAGYFTANITHIGDQKVGTGKLDLNFTNEGKIFQSDDWSKLSDNQPFFAQISTPEAEYDIYGKDLADVDRVKWVGEDWHPQVAQPEDVNPPPYYPDHPLTRREWARYLNSISGMDVRVGWILDRLEKEGLAENTVVVFFADNGRMAPRGIHWLWNSGINVPLIVRWPENYPAPQHYEGGTNSDRLISLLDLTATTLSIAGIDRPPVMQSRDFLGESVFPPRTYAFSARDRIDAAEMRLRSVHDGRYHYIRNYTPGAGFPTMNRYKETCFPVKRLMRRLHAEGKLSGPAADLMKPLPEELLYDTKEDPHEINNLADSDDPEHRQALTRLRAALQTWEVETGDLGPRDEPDQVIEEIEKRMHEWFGTPEWYEPGKSPITLYKKWYETQKNP